MTKTKLKCLGITQHANGGQVILQNETEDKKKIIRVTVATANAKEAAAYELNAEYSVNIEKVK